MEAANKDSVIIDFIVNAPIDTVWRAWTDPVIILKWFGSDPNGSGIKAELDVQPGRKFSVTFRDSNGTQHTCFGIYKEVEQPNKLSFSWEWENERGVESFVEVKLIPGKGYTRMHFVHSRLGEGSAHDYLPGWKSTFEKLNRLLTDRDW